MSFRAAYHSLGSNRSRDTALIRDKTPEQDKKAMDDYYIRMQEQKNGVVRKPSQHSR